MTRSGPPSRAFGLAVAVLAAVLVVVALRTAAAQWFSRDDFAFLSFVQIHRPWSWWHVFAPLEERFWMFYRPLGMETYFRLGFDLFGLHAFGYLAVSLAVHFASGALVFRLARQLGLDARVAAATALLAVSRPPSLSEVYYVAVFYYVSGGFFTLAALVSFADFVHAGRRRMQALSLLALLLALLCNETPVVLPAVLVLLAWALGEGAAASLRRAWPQAALVAAYALFRFRWIAPVTMPDAYAPQFGGNLWRTPLAQLGDLLGGGLAAGVVAAAALGLAAGLAASPRGRAALAGLGRPVGFAAGWTAASLAPFVLLAAPQPRHSMVAEAPFCLLLGALLEAAWRTWGTARARVFEALLVAGLALAVPWPLLRERALHPFGAPARQLVRWIDAQQPPLSPRATIVVLFGAPGLASREEGERFRYLLYGGGVLNAAYPKLLRVMRFADLSQRPARTAVRPDSAVLALRPGMDFGPAPEDLLDRELWRRFEPPSAGRVVPTEPGG